MSQTVTVGMIGTGPHATENLIPAILQHGRVKLTAFSSSSLEKAKQYAQRYGAKLATDDWNEIVDPSVVDAVVVSATPQIHADVASMCLERGVHVFVEKPPAPDSKALQALARIARQKSKTVTFVDFNFRYGETFAKSVEIVKSRGEIRFVMIRFVSSRPRKPLWGYNSLVRSILHANGIHAIDMAIHLIGSIENVTAKACWITKDIQVSQLILQGPDGRDAVIHLGNYSNRFEYRLELLGSSGIAVSLDQHHKISIFDPQRIQVWSDLLEGKDTIQYAWPSLRGGFRLTGYEGAIRSFYESIVSGNISTSSLASSQPTYDIMDKLESLLEAK
jgi:phthalate 4,5-cis-dihydrodiol dehydrogenase